MKAFCAFVAGSAFEAQVFIEEQAQLQKDIAIRRRTVVNVRTQTHLSVAVEIDDLVERINNAVLNIIQERRFPDPAVHRVAQITSAIDCVIGRTCQYFHMMFGKKLIGRVVEQLTVIPAIGQVATIDLGQNFDDPIVMRPRIILIRPTPIRRRRKPFLRFGCVQQGQ